MPQPYLSQQPARSETDQLQGAAVLDFGTNWCGHCQRAQPLVDAAFTAHPSVTHIKVEDGSGLALGRSFGVKLWPTLVFLQNGKEVERLVRPQTEAVVGEALARIDAPAPAG